MTGLSAKMKIIFIMERNNNHELEERDQEDRGPETGRL